MKLKRLFTIMNSVMVLVMIVMSIFLCITITRMNEDVKWVTHTHRVINQAENIMMDMINKETGMRGFLATGNINYLEPYKAAVKDFDERIEALKTLVKDQPNQVAKLVEIQNLSDAWHMEASDVYLGIKREILQSKGVKNELQVLTTSGLGKEKMDGIRRLLMSVEDETLQLKALVSMINMETGVRAYIINEEEFYLEPYYEGFNDISGHLSEIDDPQLNIAVEDWISNIAEKEIQLIKKSLQYKTEKDLYKEISKGTGKMIMDRLRVEINDLVLVEEALLEQRNQQLISRYQFSLVVLSLAVGIMIVIGLFQVMMINRVTEPLSKFAKQMSILDPSRIDDAVIIRDNKIYEVNELTLGYTRLLEALKESQLKRDQVEAELDRLTKTDQLTGVYNRRGFDFAVELEWRRAVRNKIPLTLLMLDIDFFKNYNDVYGHIAGDEALKKVSKIVSETLHRPYDLVARYGGEEFVVMLPETDREGGMNIATSIRQAVESLAIPNDMDEKKGVLTLSIGIASMYPEVTDTVEQLLEFADFALYEAKKSGRNRCVLFKECK